MTEPSPAPLADAYAALAGLLLTSETFDELARQIAVLAARTVPHATTCGITVAVDGRVLTVACTDGLGRLLDERRYELGEGPCLEAVRTGHSVSAPDLAVDTRWNGYPVRVSAHGIASVYSVPMIGRDQTLGALTVYGREPHAFDTAGQELTRAVANLAAAGMAGALASYDEITLTRHLRRALTTRGVIDQAIGILIATRQCSAGEAFHLLRRISQDRNIRLHTVAADLVERTGRSPREVPASHGSAR